MTFTLNKGAGGRTRWPARSSRSLSCRAGPAPPPPPSNDSSSNAVRSAVSGPPRPVNTGLRAGTFHTRPTAARCDPARGSSNQRREQCLAQSLRCDHNRGGGPHKHRRPAPPSQHTCAGLRSRAVKYAIHCSHPPPGTVSGGPRLRDGREEPLARLRKYAQLLSLVRNKQHAIAGHCHRSRRGKPSGGCQPSDVRGAQVIEQSPAQLMQRPLTVVMRAVSSRDCADHEHGPTADFR